MISVRHLDPHILRAGLGLALTFRLGSATALEAESEGSTCLTRMHISPPLQHSQASSLDLGAEQNAYSSVETKDSSLRIDEW